MKFHRLQIDYYGGAHGNFLEYLVNRYVFGIESAKFYPFTEQGTSHVKPQAYIEDRLCESGHYSYNFSLGNLIGNNDGIIRITIDKIYPALYNSLTRAGEINLDIDCLEVNTLAKLSEPKFAVIRQDLIDKLGVLDNYPRSEIRNLFYSAMREPKFGADNMQNWAPLSNDYCEFPISAFYNYIELVHYLGQVSLFAGRIGWNYDSSLYDIWSEFINKNTGYQSYVKCQQIITNMLAGDNIPIECTVLEEAYINFYITDTFNLYSNIDCFTDNYPKTTQELYQAILKQTGINRDIQPH